MGFNPYFTGCSTSTGTYIISVESEHICFNPYFTGCSTSTKNVDYQKQAY